MHNIFYFGEKLPGYPVPVLNEREIRASAGILFVFALTAFFNALLLGNYFFIKIFVIAFIIEFSIRVFINPKYAPVMILGRLAVSNQTPEYSGAPQKRFAWSLGLILAAVMFIQVIVRNAIGPLNLGICLVCLSLFFLETSMGICVGCKLYNLLNKDQAKLCPGNVCEINVRQDIQKVRPGHLMIAGAFIILILALPLSGLLPVETKRSNMFSTAPQKLVNEALICNCGSGNCLIMEEELQAQ